MRTVVDTVAPTTPPDPTGRSRCRAGLLGCGTVGSAVARGLAASGTADVVTVAFRDEAAHRPAELGNARRTTDPMAVVNGDVDVVIEVMGGTDIALDAITAALDRGVPVVTANKAVIASDGPRLEALARRRGTVLRYDAAVAGAIPATAVIADLARTDRVRRISGILNGTANHVLTIAPDVAFDLDAAVADARRRGYAEADPTRDLDGSDAADKLVILARLAWGNTHDWARSVTTADVEREGLQALTTQELAATHTAGGVWRLVAEATADGNLRVAPRKFRGHHHLATVRGPRNLVEIEAAMAGRLTLTGEGAGGDATASAVLRDLDGVIRTIRPAGRR